jgi:hypothetical protein
MDLQKHAAPNFIIGFIFFLIMPIVSTEENCYTFDQIIHVCSIEQTLQGLGFMVLK